MPTVTVVYEMGRKNDGDAGWLTVIAAVAALAAAILLYYAGIGVPPRMQTWDGVTPSEMAQERRQASFKWWGLSAAVVAAFAAIGAAVIGLP